MAKILADRDIVRLLTDVIEDGDENLVNPNGIRLRLGSYVRFHTTGRHADLKGGDFLKVRPGETVVISSYETIDFRREAVQKVFPGCTLMALIHPTTTMMREGISQVSTRIDVGFHGTLNWGLRNGSRKDLLLRYGEPIFKLTIFSLEGDEIPDVDYGSRDADRYQGTEGILGSARSIPADIPSDRIIASGFEKLDPKKQLREAGYPFDHIATELTQLDGKFEVVSKEVLLLKGQFEKTTAQLTQKIDTETQSLIHELAETKSSLLDKMQMVFADRIIKLGGCLLGAVSTMFGAFCYLKTKLDPSLLASLAILLGVTILVLTLVLTRRKA
jgi:deoxycytidine triphosphate deaminase